MSLLEKVTTGRQHRPRRTVLYGVHGIGKSTWASMWPNPVFVPTEDGVADLDVASFPLCKELIDCWGAVMELAHEEASHAFKTVVIDSADWLEQLIWQEICAKAEKQAITDFDFGKGYGEAASIFGKILRALDGCRDRGMHVVILAHSEIKRFEAPGVDSYDRYTPKLHKSTAGLLQEWADEVLFATYKVDVRTGDEGFGRERGIAIGKGERVIHTQEGPAHLAKNRLGLPSELPLDFRTYKQFLDRKNETSPAPTQVTKATEPEAAVA